MLELTDEAVESLRPICEDGGGLRFTAIDEGDDEAEIQVDEADGPADGDVVVERDGARVFLDPAAAELLDDQILDVEAHGDHFHFGFLPQGE